MAQARRAAGLMLTDATPEVLVRAIENHNVELSIRWTGMQGGEVLDEPDLLVTITGLPVSFTNGVRRARLARERAEERVREVAALLRDRAVPALWWVGPLSTPAELPTLLEGHGFRKEEDMPWMAAELDSPPSAELPEGIRAHRVDGPERHEQWLDAMTVGFGMNEHEREAMASLAGVVGHADDAPWQRFVALEGDEPVASSGLMLGGGVAGIYNVATAPAARGRGIGAAMTSLAMDRARDIGYRVAVLGSSALAVPLYERLGFRHVCVVAEYEWLPEPAGGG